MTTPDRDPIRILVVPCEDDHSFAVLVWQGTDYEENDMRAVLGAAMREVWGDAAPEEGLDLGDLCVPMNVPHGENFRALLAERGVRNFVAEIHETEGAQDGWDWRDDLLADGDDEEEDEEDDDD